MGSFAWNYEACKPELHAASSWSDPQLFLSVPDGCLVHVTERVGFPGVDSFALSMAAEVAHQAVEEASLRCLRCCQRVLFVGQELWMHPQLLAAAAQAASTATGHEMGAMWTGDSVGPARIRHAAIFQDG